VAPGTFLRAFRCVLPMNPRPKTAILIGFQILSLSRFRLASYAKIARVNAIVGHLFAIFLRLGGFGLLILGVLVSSFLFLPFATASAFQYPRTRLLGVIAAARFVRFLGVGMLAIVFGESVLRMAETPSVQIGILVLAAICVAGSAVSIASWIKRRKKRPAR